MSLSYLINEEKDITEGGKLYSEFRVELHFSREYFGGMNFKNSHPKIHKNEAFWFEYHK